ncbi:MAG: hypothetical protein ACWA5L_09910 [bacterium]
MLKSSIRTVALAAFSSIAVFSPSARAQAPTPTTPFSVEEAAYCTATFGWILQNLAPNGMPKDAQFQANLAFMIWGYELNAAKPGADEATMKAIAQTAISQVNAKMPDVTGEGSGKKIVEFITGEATTCGKKLQEHYPNGNHPVIAEVQRQIQAAKAAEAAQPAASE